MESAGARLKKIRLEKGLTLEEAHKKTRINLNILKALEEDSLLNFSPVYIRGFLKIYCKFLGVDPQEFIPAYKEPQSKPVYVSGLGVQEWPLSMFEIASRKLRRLEIRRLKIKPFVLSLLAILFLFGLFNLGKSFSKRSLIPRKNQILAPKTEKKGAPDKEQKAPVPVSAASPKRQEAIPPAEATLGVTVGIHAKEDCYIYLKTDGKVVFQGVLKKGRAEDWQAKNKIEFSLGNAGAVDLEVNGKRILPLGRRGHAVKNIVIDKEGIKVKR